MKDRKVFDVMDRLSSIWGDLQQTNRFPWNGQLMSTCEAELQELMKQIDIMVQNKKLEWDRELQATEAKLQLKERECTMQKATAEQKAREIDQLRQQVEAMERNNRLNGTEYERNLEKVKSDFNSLKKDYEKLQRKMAKHTKEVAKEKTKTSTELQDTQTEMQRAQARLDEYRQRSKDWDLEKRNLEKQVESLESQRRTLQEKCDLIEQQASGYQSQLDRRRQILDNTEYNLKTQISQLESQVERAQETIASQDSQIAKLKVTLEETVSLQRRALDEKDYTERELRESRQLVTSLEEQLCNLKLEFQKQEEYLRIAQSGQQSTQAHVQKLEQSLYDKQQSSTANELLRGKDETIRKLNDDLKQAKNDIKQHKKTEKRLNEELSRQKSQIKEAEMDVEKLRVKFQERMSSKGSENKKVKELQSEISKLKQSLTSQRESSEVQLSDMTRKVATLQHELDERSLAASSLNDQLLRVQSQHRQDGEKFDQRAAELQVANAQLEALRLENRHLRQTAMKQIQTNADVMEAEAHLKELQNAYSASLSRIEGENRSLHHQMDALQTKIREMETECADKEKQARAAAQRSIQELQTMEERRIQEVQADYENRLNNVQLKMDRKLRDARMELDQILHEKHTLEQELRNKTTHMKRAFTENEVMTQFVEGVSDVICQASPDVRRRMVTPRLVGALDTESPFIPHNFEANLFEARSTKTSTKVHFNDSELPNQSQLLPSPNSFSSLKTPNQNQNQSSDMSTQLGARPKTKMSENSAFEARESDNNNSIDGRVSPKREVKMTSPLDIRIQSPLCGRDIGSPSKVSPHGPVLGVSPLGHPPSPLRVPSPLRIPSPSHSFHRISPNQRSEMETSERRPRSISFDERVVVADSSRPNSAPGNQLIDAPGAGNTSGGGNAGANTGAVGGMVDMAAMVNLSLSDTSDSERPPSRASLASRFYEEEQERAKELERLIDSHIEDLKVETEKTIKKYTR